MKEFILHWKSGPDENIWGDNIAQAMTAAGYGGGAHRALDYWEEVKDKDPAPPRQDQTEL